MWINNNLIEKQIKEGEDIPEGFSKGRLKRITKAQKLALVFPKKEIFDYYIVENHDFISSADHFNLSRNDFRILLYEYKIYKDPKKSAKNNKYRRTHEQSVEIGKKSGKTQRENYKNKSDDEKREFSEERKKQHNTELFRKKISEINKEYQRTLTKEKKEEMNKARSSTLKKFWSNEKIKKETLDKMKETYKKNQGERRCRTIAEQKLFDVLYKKFSDLEYDVRVDDRYPYFCDFYIPSLDLFIELNAHPSHGRLPFDRLKFEEYQNYKSNWFEVLSKRDVEKFNKAVESKINYIRIYPQATLDENIDINPNEFREIVKISYESQK